MKTIVMDLDGTLTEHSPGVPYAELSPNLAVVAKLREYRAQGFKVAIYTSRNMRTHANSIGRINALTLPVIIDWLKAHDIPFDEIHVGKPWPEAGGFYVDDRAIRPDEFVNLSYPEIMALTGAPLQ
jgi:capsule biosynthesis phosphatase